MSLNDKRIYIQDEQNWSELKPKTDFTKPTFTLLRKFRQCFVSPAELGVHSTGGSAHTKVKLFPARLFLTFIYEGSHQRFVSSPLNFPSLLAEVRHTLDPSHSPPKKKSMGRGI